MPDFERLLTGKRVFVTGHSGFSGSWLCAWFRRVGIAVSGYSLVPEPHEVLFGQLDLAADVNSTWADILDLETLKDAMRDAAP
ncbi:MAG: CDP-glucose 4,6-dehydratase, partial [Mesorhizobium sp.]